MATVTSNAQSNFIIECDEDAAFNQEIDFDTITSIPADATITGIQISTNGGWTSPATAYPLRFYIFRNGTSGTGVYKDSLSTETLGGNYDTWGWSFTPTLINGARISVNIEYDGGRFPGTGGTPVSYEGGIFTLTIYYSQPTLGSSVETVSVGGKLYTKSDYETRTRA